VKTRTHTCMVMKFSLAVLALAIAASAVNAEPLMAVGPYSDAKARAADHSASGSRVSATQSGGQSSGQSSGQPTVAVQVKQWVKTKYRIIRSLWTGEEPNQQVAEKSESQKLGQKGSQKSAQAGSVPGAMPTSAGSSGSLSAAPESSTLPKLVAAPVPRPANLAPGQSLEKSLRAPSAAPAVETHAMIDPPGMRRTSDGIAVYDLASSSVIPRLKIGHEEAVSTSRYALDSSMQKVLDDRVVHQFESPDLLSKEQLKKLTALHVARAGEIAKVKDAVFSLKGKVSREAFDKIAINLKPELELKLRKFIPLTPEESRFLSGLYLYQQGDNCPTAIGLFYKLSKAKGWEAESNYYLAMCSKQMGLNTDFHERARRVLEVQDVHYSRKILNELTTDIPYEISESFGATLSKAVLNPKIMADLKPATLANVAYLLADYSISAERFKTALEWAAKVPADHPKYLKAQFLLALAEYQAGSKEKAIQIQDMIVNEPKTDKARMEFQALVALNAARMHFQEQDFKAAHGDFLKVYKDHPLWLQSLTELGWAQLQDGDFEGAIGNMYSIQSPFFTAVYKPESYVIRTIGYLNLCQYGDAYKTLSILEHDYRPYFDKMDKYVQRAKTRPAYYQTVKNFLTAPKNSTEVDGLPLPVVREMARHRDFTNLQKALNRQIDERPNYARIDSAVEARLKSAQTRVNSTRNLAQDLRKKIGVAIARKNIVVRKQLQEELEEAVNKLNEQFFEVDLYKEAKISIDEYRKEVVAAADRRLVSMRGVIEHVLSNRLLKMKVDLARVLDNNELLRYEVFSGCRRRCWKTCSS
jgi:hypothetical protein